MIGVRYVSLHEGSGYGVSGYRNMRGLIRCGVPLTWTPMVPGMGWGLGYEPFRGREVEGAGDLVAYCNREIDYDTVIVHTVPEYFPLWRDALRDEVGAAPLLLGHTVWETSRLPRHWPDLLRAMDGLLVPCQWNREIFEGAGLGVPVELLPHACLEATCTSRDAKTNTSPFRFTTINAWTPRKAIDLSLEAYLRAFDSGDDVEFVIKTGPEDLGRERGPLLRRLLGRYPHVQKAIASQLARHAKPAAVRLVTEVYSHEEMLELHGSADAYLSLTRSEGWGVGAFDAATLGVPVVMTGFGGQLDYLGRDYPGLVRFESTPVAPWSGGESYTSDQLWAEPNVDHAAQLLRELRANPAPWRAQALQLGREIRANFAPERIASDLIETIGRIEETRRKR